MPAGSAAESRLSGDPTLDFDSRLQEVRQCKPATSRRVACLRLAPYPGCCVTTRDAHSVSSSRVRKRVNRWVQ
jgi:hypothetical protein